ncbi:hypothetical protein CEXT_622051 [Caerostris extrusa]|uniref:Uncharacterized protein n=1 Tax=Caerostris extrusa TaxID=172846 RepID=A0AAV4Y7M8_CAEEX|nr:hypothetical protein CEXT_622051 [Caerostris extrusa]
MKAPRAEDTNAGTRGNGASEEEREEEEEEGPEEEAPKPVDLEGEAAMLTALSACGNAAVFLRERNFPWIHAKSVARALKRKVRGKRK